MRKFLSFLSILLIINNIFIWTAFSAGQITISSLTLKVNSGNAQNGNVEAQPWDTIHILMSGQNIWDAITNAVWEFTFSSSDFTYSNAGEIDSYKNWVLENENIDTNNFNPPTDNIVPIASNVATSDYMDLYYLDLLIDQDISDTQIDLTWRFNSDSVASSTLSRTAYINSRPHIIDYYFEQSWTTVTALQRWWEQIDFVLKVKDYNGCTNIDSANVNADLSKLWLTATESLSFVSCSSNEAIYKKTGIATLVSAGTLNFVYWDFSVSDENWNVNKPDDSDTTFDNEDKKDSLSLEITSAWTPTVSLGVDDSYIWSSLNDSSILSYSWSQNWEIKITAWWDGTCTSGTTLQDWTTGYTGSTDLQLTVNASSLSDGVNTIYVCLKNDENNIWSSNVVITKDTTVPTISSVTFGPVNVVTEDSETSFICSEAWNYQIEKWWSSTLNSWTVLSTWIVLSSIQNNIAISNSDLATDANTIFAFCLDNASNYASYSGTINKTTAPPSLASITTTLSDSDSDYDGIDGRDFTFTWDSTLATSYTYFQSYRLYILPSNVTFDSVSHTHTKLITTSTDTTFTWDETITSDSMSNALVSGASYKMCVAIMWSNGVLSTPGCSSASTITWDTVTNATIVSAKFTSDTNLEITTDATLDTSTSNHSWSLISFTYNGGSVTGTSVSSVSDKIINITIPSLSSISAIWTDLIVATWAIRASGGWFNNLATLSSITDGQDPTIANFTKNTSSIYNSFYTGSIDFSYTFLEDMKNSSTKFEFSREWWNADSNSYNFAITGNDLLSWTRTSTIDLSSLWLVDGVFYGVKIIWEDEAGNYVTSSSISNIKYDTTWPDIVIQNVTALYGTDTPSLTWDVPSDNNGNGSGVKEYTLQVYNGSVCSGTATQEHSVTTNSKTLTTLWNVADYSWKVSATDNMWNVWTTSMCSTFRVDTNQPTFSNYEIKDTVISSTSYLKQSNAIEVKSTITHTDTSHIWADLSMITWNPDHTSELCSSPSSGIICTLSSDIVTYSFTASGTLSDGGKQVSIKSQNTSWWNEDTIYISSTADSTAPTIDSDALTAPTGTIWWTWATISWTTSKITDAIWLNNIKLEYAVWAWSWTAIATTPNNGSYTWDLTGLSSATDYKLQLTAYDEAGNEFSREFSTFIVDVTSPNVPYTVVASPNGGEIIKGNATTTITWNAWSVTDTSLATNPIKLEYSIDNGVNYVVLAENLANSGTYDWAIPDLDSSTVLLKLTAYDTVWNSASDTTDNKFIIDSTLPALDFTYTNTPPNGSYINSTGIDITGTTSDTYFSKLQYKLQNTTDSTYYDGSAFTGTESWVDVCTDWTSQGTDNSCDTIGFTLTPTIVDVNNYTFTLKSTDEVWNETLSVPLAYVWDITNPTLSVTTASGTYFQSSLDIAGTSSDAWSGISSVKIQIKEWTNYWDGSNFVASAQTLNTTTTDSYANWTYNFNYSWSDADFEVTVIAYDSAYKVNNSTSSIITVTKDSVEPSITWGTALFTSPLSNSIHIGGNSATISWTSWNITDAASWLTSTPIKLEYFDGTDWNIIADNEVNDWTYTWATIPALDLSNAKIRLTATDNVWNTKTQLGDTFIIDSTPPTVSSVETMDMDTDGQIDALNITMSESIIDSTITLANFSISDSIGTPTSWETWSSSDDGVFLIKFSDTLDTSSTPSVTYTKWTLTDLAWKFLENTTQSSVDKAAPRLLKSEIFDEDKNGKFDKIVAEFSENLSSSTDTTAWSVANLLTWISIGSVSTASSVVNITLNEWTDFDTAVWSMDLTFTSNTNWTDSNTNVAGSVSNISITDKAEPVVVSAEYLDEDSNYKVDKVDILFSENLLGFSSWDFTVSGLIKSTALLSSATVSINVTETSNDNDTWVLAYFSFSNSTLRDSANNFVSQITNQQITDKIAPKLLSIETWDSNNNGKIDFVRLAYSENMNTDFASFVWEVDSYTISSYSKFNDSTLQFNLTEKSSYDSGETPNVQVVSNTSLKDLNDNSVNATSSTVSDDKVGPVITWSRYDSSSHKMYLSFSENINSSDFLIENFILSNAGTYIITWVDSSEKSITLTSETVTYWSTQISFQPNLVGDSLWNKQSTTSYVEISPPIIINEVMSSSTSANNYVELRNLSDSSVDIWNFTVAWITIPASTTITSGWYYLISKDTKANSLINVDPDLVSSSLDISWSQITLNNGVLDIDYANLTGPLDTATPKAMERIALAGDGRITSNWYTAQVSTGFDTSTPYGTPGVVNVQDITAPTISSYFPGDDTLLPHSTPTISIDYSDNVWGLWIDASSDTIELYKWDGSSWWTDIASTYVNTAGKVVNTTSATYSTNSLPYWKYKIDFSISDTPGNRVNKTIIFYVDLVQFDIDVSSISIWDIHPEELVFSDSEATITIKTIWAGFTLNMSKIANFTYSGTDITDWDGNHGFWFNKYDSWYDGTVTSMGSSISIVTQSQNINTSWELNTYTYKVKYWAKVGSTQAAWYYTVDPTFSVLLDY